MDSTACSSMRRLDTQISYPSQLSVFRCPETEQLVADMIGAIRVVVFDHVRQLSSSKRGHL